MNIRLMTVTDHEKVHALWLSCKGMGLNDIDDSKEGITGFWSETRRPALWRRRTTPSLS